MWLMWNLAFWIFVFFSCIFSATKRSNRVDFRGNYLLFGIVRSMHTAKSVAGDSDDEIFPYNLPCKEF